RNPGIGSPRGDSRWRVSHDARKRGPGSRREQGRLDLSFRLEGRLGPRDAGAFLAAARTSAPGEDCRRSKPARALVAGLGRHASLRRGRTGIFGTETDAFGAR